MKKLLRNIVEYITFAKMDQTSHTLNVLMQSLDILSMR